MLERFRQYAKEQHLFPDGGEVLLAVSGGRDSVVLADLVHRCGRPFAVAHCNFHLRPGECDRDQRFVQQLAERLGVRFHTIDFDTRAYAAEHGLSIEEAARDLRYSWFATLCCEHGYGCLATAHHRDDSIETFFLNLFRGTGIAGLHGIRPSSTLHARPLVNSSALPISLVRPLLCFSRADIDSYVAERGLDYVDDSTNALLDARRNRIRLQLMPLLRELYPAVDATMQANIDRLADAGHVYDDAIEALRSRIVRRYVPALPGVAVHMSCIMAEDIRSLSPRRTLFFELMRPYDFNISTVDDMLCAVDDGRSGRIFHSATHVAELHRGQILIAPDADVEAPRLAITSDCAVPESFSDVDPQRTCYIDAAAVQGVPRLRLWADGDRFRPLGMHGSRLVSDFLKDSGLSLIERRNVYLLVDEADRPLWLVGLRADDRTRITPDTVHAIRVDVV